MGASNFLHNKAQERAKKIDSKYGEGAYGGTLWQSQMQNASSYSQDNVSESGSFLQRKIAQRQAAKTNTPSSNASYKKEYGTNVSTSGIYSQPVLSATEYQKEIDRLTNEKSDYSKKWREEYISKFIAGDEEWNKYQNALKDYDRQIEEMKAGKWKAEKSAKYGNLSSNADYAEKSKVIDKTLGTTFGVTIGDNFYGIGDDVYAYVNDIGKRQSLSKFSGNTGDAGMYKYSYMTQQEKDNYNYLYQTEGKKSANDYLDYISYDLDARRTKDLSGQWSEFADEHPVAASALSVPSNLMSGIGLADVAVQNIERSISGEYKPINYNSVGMNATNMTTAIRGTVSQNLADEYGTININSEEHPIFARILNGKSLGDVYQLGMSMVDSAATAAIGSVTGIGAFGTILLGGSAGSQGVLTALEKGATDEQALAMGLLNGTFEALFEFVSIDKLLKGNTKSILKAFFEQGFVEGTEELNTTLFNTIADICVMAENSDYQNMIKSYLEKGYSQKDAERMAMQDIAIGMGWDFIGGAISGGIMGGGKTAINNTIIEPHYYSNTYGQSVQELVSESLEINPGNKLASEIKSKLDSNKNVSGRKIMQLVNQNESDMVSNDKATIQEAAAKQLTEYGETGDVAAIAQAITKQVSGEKLTQSDRSLISQSKYGQRVANELNAENINSGEYNTSWAETLGTSRINPKEYSRLLQEANNEPQSDSAHQQSVYTAQAENAQQAQTVAQREAVQDAEKESAAETTYQDSNAEAPAAVGAAAIAESAAAEDVSANDDGSAIKAASVKYGAQAGAFLHTYQPGQDVKKYDDAYRTAYDMGKSGVPMRTVKSMGSVSYLTEAQREYAYEAGQAASDAEAKAQEAMNGSGNKRKTGRRKGTVKGEGVRISDLKKTFNDPQNKSYRILTKFAEATGIDIVLYNSHANENGDFTAANGRFSWREDKIYIDINAGLSTINDVGSFEKYTMLRTFSHEFLHFLEKWNPVQYNEFRRVVFDAMNEKLALKNADSETKITLDDIINERMDKWNKGIDKMNEGKAESEKAPHVTYEQASREVVAEAMTDILPDSGFMDELYNNHRNLFTKIVEKLKEFLADLKAYFSSITPNNRMEAALLKEDVGGTIRYMQSIVDAFDKLALGGVENYQKAQAEQELTNAGIIVDNSTDSASINSYSVRYLLDDKQKEKVTASLVKRFGVTKEEATNWLTAETSIASLVLNPKYSQYLDYEADPDEVAIKKNSDYPQGTVDFSPICKKRREFTSVMNAVFRQFPNHVFAATDLARIRTIMGEEGMTLPCGICYVEDRRQLDSIVAQDFLNGLKLYREGSTTRPDGKPFNTNQLRGLRYTDGDSYVPTIAELITLDGQNELKKKNPNMSEAWRRYNNARGMQSVRRLANEAEYKRQILKYSQKTVKSKNDNGGLRIYSFSDAEMFHLIDIIQIITDSSSVGLCLQGYTKVNEYAKAVRNTGEKLNRSLIPLGDLGYHMENGKVVLDFDTVEGIDINDPAFFDNSDNPDVGNIVIGINDTQIRAAMVSPFIDQIIPFHTGQSEEVLKEKNIDAWDNYKDYQTEKDISTGKTSKHQINIYTEVIQVLEAEGKAINKRTFVEKFLQVCKENVLTPRFAQFLNTDANGDYVYTEGYHKMLVDFKTFAQTETGEYLPQMPVKPVFDDAYLGEILKAYVEEQTAKDSRVARSMPKVVERIANEIIQPSQEQNYEQYSVRVTDKDTLDFLNQQEESGDVIKTYKAMQVIDGKLYPPMAAKVKDENGKYRLSPPAAIGVWQQSVEDPSHLKKDKEGNILLKKNKKTGVMYGSYDLNKGNGKVLPSIAYAPYEHSSNVVLNDQFEEAYQRPNIVTVECIIPKSEMTSGYRAPYAKDATGILDWKEGVVARQLSNNHRKVYLSRYLKPVRILSNAETAQMYKQILDNEENVTVPFNVVTPGLLAELEKLDVPIDYEGSPNYRSHNKKDQYEIRDNNRFLSKEELSAIEKFGTTENFEEAGYILANGEMLKFTDESHPGERNFDHRAIAIAYGKDIDLSKNHGFDMYATPYLERFVEDGAIRIDTGSLLLNMDVGLQLSSNVPLTVNQEQTIRDMIEWKNQREEMYRPSDDEFTLYGGPLSFHVEFGGNASYAVGSVNKRDLDAWGIKSLHYEGGNINPYRVISDIRHYYETGETRQQSDLMKFHTQYSIRDDAPAEIHKAVTDKNYGGDIRLTDTSPSIMLGHKGVKNLPMLMKASHVRENILTEEEAKKLGLRVTPDINYHGLGEELFKKVIDSLDDINVAYRGTPKADDPSRRENCFLLLSTVKDSNGDTIIVPVYINETGSYNRVFIKTNKIASVYGKNGLDEYIRNEIKKGNLVRIKKRGPTSSESPAPIAVDYAGVTSAEEAADQTAMASYADSITPDSQNSQDQSQVRESNLSDADVLVIAAEAVKNNDERYNWLTAGEKDALNIFLKKATTLKEAQQMRYELLDRKKWLMDNKDTRQRGELAKVQNNLDTVNAQIRRAQDEILKVEDQKVIRKVLKQARRVVERDSLQRGLEELQAYKNKRNDTESARKYRQRVVDTAMEMSEWLRKNSDKEHVPEILKKPVLELLTSIDFSSKRFLRGGELTKADKKFGANLAELQKLLNGQQGAIEGEESAVDNIGAYLDISVENRQFLNDLVNTLASVDGTFTINKMTAEELKSFSKFLSNLATAIRKANKTLANARYQNIPDIALSSMRHMEEMGNAPASDGTPTAKFLKWTNTTPYYAFKRFGEAGEALFDGFTRGWEKLAFNAQEIIDFTNKTYTAKEIRKWRSEIHDITLEDGRTVQMTTAQIMELSQLLNREQARKHIEAGGIRIGTIQTKKGPKNDTEHYHFTVNDLKNVVGLLNDRQLQVAEELRRYMGRRGGEWGNEISMARFGYQFYTEGENYYTIRTDANGRPLRDTDEQTSSMFRLLNLSSSKSLNPNANNALIVSDIFDTFADHMADMAKLNALGLPLLDAIKWYNYTERFNNSDGTMDEEGVKKSMEKAFGTAAGSYFRTLLKDINGVKESGDRGGNFASRMMSNYKVAAVGANLRVALLQPTSYVRAMYVLKPKNMIAALAFKKNAYKEAMQYSGTAVWKSLGYYDTDIAKSMRSQIEHDDTWLDKVKDKSLALAELGDQRTWGRLWVACKLEAKERNSSLTGEELCRATSDIFREVIYATQVMDSTLTRSEMMRGSTRWTKLTTAFMAEPTLSLNILGDWVSQFTIDKRKTNLQKAWSKNRGKFALAVTTYVCSAAAAALMESIMDAFRDDDDYETFLDKFLQAFLGEEGFLDGNLGQDLTVIGKIPVLKDIISTIRGIKSSDMSLAAITSISNAYAIWKESIALANGTLDKATNVTWYGKMTDWGKIYKTLQALSQLTGVSLSNMTRDVVAIWNTTVGSMTPGMKIKTYDPGEKNSIKYAYQDGYLTEEEAIDKLLSTGEAEDSNEAYWIVNEWSTGGSKYDAMKEAIKANDSAAYNNAMSELTGHGIDEESALTEARKAIHESYASGEINDSQAVSYLQKYGGKEEDKARESVELWKFKAASDEYDDITASAVAKYNEYCAGTGMSKDTYYKAWSVIKDIRGEDRNGDGTNDAYSAMDKKLDYIGSLSISYDQKYALALASGISEKNIRNRANW